jgi:hypothetical protein
MKRKTEIKTRRYCQKNLIGQQPSHYLGFGDWRGVVLLYTAIFALCAAAGLALGLAMFLV